MGDVDAEFAKGGKIIEAEYYVPHAGARLHGAAGGGGRYRDGKVDGVGAARRIRRRCRTPWPSGWASAQENVICHVTLLGGGFGRKSKPDYVAEAAVLSKKSASPVKVVWTPRGRHQVRLLPLRRGACT